MQAVLSLLSAYDVSMVAYSCREGKEASEMFRGGIYQVYINHLLVPAPAYTISNFYSRFCMCNCCGVNPRISLYSWSFLPRSHRALDVCESWPPVFDTKCADCTLAALYNWFESGERISICNFQQNILLYELDGSFSDCEDGDDLLEKYTSFSVSRLRHYHSKYSSNDKCVFCRCMFCRKDVTDCDRTVGVLINDDVYMMPDTYHIECFFSQFAVWKDCGRMTIEEQILPSVEIV